ncbi:hypothetical protein [Sphingomonas sp.]|uniref:hypothetical protein n=1 Tax=Sphingomonas sp. TaxID=28214 RepID=UPI00286A2994|nr:hypothetical protein [Sphingomonas sp.]
MNGWMGAQEALFYGFSLADQVPAGHLLRLIDRFVDLSGIASTSGKVDPEARPA